MTFYCMVCRGPMPEERLRKNAKTCAPKPCNRIWRLEYLRKKRMANKLLGAKLPIETQQREREQCSRGI